MRREKIGTDGRGNEVELVTLENANGTQAKISTLGATLTVFARKDKHGILRDVVLGYDDPADYIKNWGYHFGATVGRNANRISKGKLTISGVEYTLERNSGTNNLHSGTNGISHKIWEIERMDEAENSVVFKIFSAHMEQDFPGNMTIRVTFALSGDDALHISYEAVSDRDTLANFTNHSYFNLAGHDSGYVGSQKLKIYAHEFTPLSEPDSIPTGEIRPVAGTPLDFTEWKEIGKEIDADYDQLHYTKGYDQNYLLENGGTLAIMAEAVSEATGIHLYASTDCPGMQLYLANFVDPHEGKGGVRYGRRHAFCLEAQYVPDAVNLKGFQIPLLKAGDVYRSETVYRLGLDS